LPEYQNYWVTHIMITLLSMSLETEKHWNNIKIIATKRWVA